MNAQATTTGPQDTTTEPKFRIRARHTDATVTVYQAYRPEIGRPAARAGRFPAARKRDRMTWIIKPRSQPSTSAAAGPQGGYSTSMPKS